MLKNKTLFGRKRRIETENGVRIDKNKTLFGRKREKLEFKTEKCGKKRWEKNKGEFNVDIFSGWRYYGFISGGAPWR